MITGKRLTGSAGGGIARSFYRGQFFAAPLVFALPAREVFTIDGGTELAADFTLGDDEEMVF